VPHRNEITLFDGSLLVAGGLRVEMDASCAAKLVAVQGDLTGEPEQSALLVETSASLACGSTLSGRMLTVCHRSSPWHTTGYTIERVLAAASGRYRIELRDHPPFLQHKMFVRKIETHDRRRILAGFQFFKGQGRGIYCGRRVLFPRSGFESIIVETPNYYHEWNTDLMLLETAPPEGAVLPGDPFVVFTIQPGDEVLVPSHFCCSTAPSQDGSSLNVFSTGLAELQIPAGPGEVRRILKGRRVRLRTGTAFGGAVSLKLRPGWSRFELPAS
jgi:hypothetical protein